MKKYIILLLFSFLIQIGVCQPAKKLTERDDTNAYRHRRTLKPTSASCSVNQYFDTHEGRCLGVVGGGKVLYINDTVSCNTNTLRPHCSNPRYYYICKKDKIILLQCTYGKHFENRLQKCVHVSKDEYVSATVNPKMETFEFTELPACKTPGIFPVPNDCAQFYTCRTNGHRLHQNFFYCPKNMAYDIRTKMCMHSDSCEGSKNLPSMCMWNIQKENPTIEEMEKSIVNLDDIKLNNSLANVSKNFTLNNNGSVTICETIFVNGENGTTVINISETYTTTQSSVNVATTSTFYEESTTSAIPETDKPDVITTTKRDEQTSRSSNSVDAATTEADLMKTDKPTFVKATKGDIESTTEPDLGGKVTKEESTTEKKIEGMEESTTPKKIEGMGENTTEKKIEESTETSINEPLIHATTLSALQAQQSTTEKVEASSEFSNIHESSTISPKKEEPSSTEINLHNSEISSSESPLKMTTVSELVSEDQHSTTEKIEPSTEFSSIHEISTISPKKEEPGSTEINLHTTETSPSLHLLKLPTLSGLLPEIQHITITPQKSDLESITQTDPIIPNSQELPNITEEKREENPKEFLNDQYSTTEKAMESSSEFSNIHESLTISPKKEVPSNTEINLHNAETSPSLLLLKLTTLSGLLPEVQHTTILPQESDPKSLIHTDPISSSLKELPNITEEKREENPKELLNDQQSTTEKNVESSSAKVTNTYGDSTILPKEEISSNTEINTNKPFVETTTLSKLFGDENDTIAPQSPINTDPKISNDQELSSTTKIENTEPSTEKPLSEITTLTESVLQDSTTEKPAESSSFETPHDNQINSANPSIFSSTENTITSTVSSENNSTNPPKNIREFGDASTKPTFITDSSDSTGSPNLNPANESLVENAVPTSNVPAKSEPVSSENESMTMKAITSPEELIANCLILSGNDSLLSTEPNSTNAGKSLNSTDSETFSNLLDKRQDSPITNEGETKNVVKKENKTAPGYFGRTISKHVVLPLMSAVLNFTDKYERRWLYSLRNRFTQHVNEHKKYT